MGTEVGYGFIFGLCVFYKVSFIVRPGRTKTHIAKRMLGEPGPKISFMGGYGEGS